MTIGRALAAAMRPDMIADIEFRHAQNAVIEQIRSEAMARPILTAENVQAEIAWQDQRYHELMAARGYQGAGR